MARKTKSARGEAVDFDILDIKAQMATAPKTVDVTAREDYVDKKLRRQVYKAAAATKAKIESTRDETEQAPSKTVDISAIEEPETEAELLEEIAEEPVVEQPKRTRKKRTIDES
jgi:hypothetical protein